MKAIILAAGAGRRLRPLADDRPKCLVTLRGRTLLDCQLGVFRRCGIDEIVVVTGHRADAIRRQSLRLYHNPQYDRTNMVASLFCAEAELDGDVVVSYGDILFEARVLRALLDDPGDFSVVVDDGWRALWSFRMDQPLDDAETLKINADGCITEIGRKPTSYGEIEGQYIGLFKISGRAIGAVRRFYHAMDRERLYDGQPFDNMYMTSFIQEAIDRLMPVRAVRVQHGWLEIDTLRDLERYAAMGPGDGDLFCFEGVA